MLAIRQLQVIVLVICQVIFSLALEGKGAKYKISEIPAELKKNAKVVIRNHQTTFKVKSTSHATLEVKYAISVLNENGIDNARFIQYYNKFSRVSGIRATIYDQYGDKVRNIPIDKIHDYSAISGYSIYEDSRVKFIDPEIRTTPFTVEYSYRVDFKGIISYPVWNLYPDYNASVIMSSYKAIVPDGHGLRYHEQNIPNVVKILHGNGNTIYEWMATSLPAIKKEPYSLPVHEVLPVVYTAPTNFEIDGYHGNSESWSEFGAWVKSLNTNKNNVPLETQEHVKDLVKNTKDDFEKIQILYNYLQNKTRYVSIQVGIGGWQPIDAETVDKLSYGDCKALTNYLYSLLDIVGIKSYYALVQAGNNAKRMITDFPSTQFNHAFLCVPLQNDTVWLECTNQHFPCGYIGTFTDDRDVLLIKENGGEVVHTKAYSEHENIQQRNIDLTLTNEGNGLAKINTRYQGIFYDDVYTLLRSDDEDKKKRIQNTTSIPSFKLTGFSHQEQKNIIPVINETLEVNVNDHGTLMGDRMIVNLNLMNKISEIPRSISGRKNDIFIRRSYIKVDTIVYQLPEKYILDKLPKDLNISSRFGEYFINTKQKDDKVIFTRYLKINKGQYPKSLYTEWVAFYEDMFKADNSKMILMEKR